MSRKEPNIEKCSLAELNRLRISIGLKPIESKIKSCLCCHKNFESEGAHNRLCRECRLKDSDGMGIITKV